MKKLNLLVLVTILFIACKESNKPYVTLSFNITNPANDSISIYNGRVLIKTIYKDESGVFKDTLKVAENDSVPNQLYFNHGTNYSGLYLKNGYDLNISLDAEDLNKSITYKGIGEVNNNFLAKQELFLEKNGISYFYDIYSSSQEFEKKIKDTKEKLRNFYETAPKTIDTALINPLKNNLDKIYTLENYNFITSAIDRRVQVEKELSGKPSPQFVDYENFEGGTSSLDDFKGKYILIDIWATWCGPCLAQVPELKKLIKDYKDKNIEFLSISIDDGRSYKADSREESERLAKEGWKKMIKDKELDGVHLYADNGWNSEFIRHFKVRGIPRFILIDPNGNVVKPNFPVPSTTLCRTYLKALNI